MNAVGLPRLGGTVDADPQRDNLQYLVVIEGLPYAVQDSFEQRGIALVERLRQKALAEDVRGFDESFSLAKKSNKTPALDEGMKRFHPRVRSYQIDGMLQTTSKPSTGRTKLRRCPMSELPSTYTVNLLSTVRINLKHRRKAYDIQLQGIITSLTRLREVIWLLNPNG